MPQLSRAFALALLAGLLAAAPVSASAMPLVQAAPAPEAALSTKKVVIVVGPTHGQTGSYLEYGQDAYEEAIKHSSNVVKVFSPNATWAAVKSALQGASIIVYMGHGNGWPSPYTYDPNYTTKDGMGLNATANNGHNNTKYYGEPYFANEIDFAPNAVVLLNHLCYASGNSEPGNAAPTLSVAMQRVDNYGAGFIKAGARAVIAEGHGSITGYIRDLFTTHQTVADVWRNGYTYHGNEFSFQSTRSPAYRAFMDPDTSSGGYYRSLVGNPDLRTEDITGVPFTPTDTAPASLVEDGAASVAAPGGVTLYDNADLTGADGNLAAATPVRVVDLVGGEAAAEGSATAAYVRGLDGWPAGWVDPATLTPQDSSPPQLWGIDGARTISPNGDGNADALNLAVNFSEDVDWSIEIRDGWTVLWSASGSGSVATISWDAKVGGVPISDGIYTMAIEAWDEWGNDGLGTEATFTVNTAAQVRLAGSDRYATAAAISAATFAPNVPVVYLATGLNFPDALAGAAVAGSQGAPILLVMQNALPNATAIELMRLKPAKIVILGSTGVVSAAVASAAAAYAPTVTRIAGADRYETAAAISAATYASGVDLAYVATGLNFPDALAGAAVAGSRGAPILLVTKDEVPQATAEELGRLHPGNIVVLGASGVVSDSVMATLGNWTDGGVFRQAGNDRYSTAAKISYWSFQPGVEVVYLATGANFPDALAGAAAAGSQDAPILLVTRDSVPAATAAELVRLDPQRIVVLGSTGVVSEATRIQLELLVN